MEIFIILVSVGVGILVLNRTWKLFFKSEKDLWKNVKLGLTPDIISFFQGKYLDDKNAELVVGIWLFLGIISGWLCYALLNNMFLQTP
jgi:hypothetical protein